MVKSETPPPMQIQTIVSLAMRKMPASRGARRPRAAALDRPGRGCRIRYGRYGDARPRHPVDTRICVSSRPEKWTAQWSSKMRASLLEMISFAIVALALVGPKLILWLLVSEQSAQSDHDRPSLNSQRHAGVVRVPLPRGRLADQAARP